MAVCTRSRTISHDGTPLVGKDRGRAIRIRARGQVTDGTRYCRTTLRSIIRWWAVTVTTAIKTATAGHPPKWRCKTRQRGTPGYRRTIDHVLRRRTTRRLR